MMVTLEYTLYFIHITQNSQKHDLFFAVPPRKTNIEINNLQPSQFLNRPVPPLPYSTDIQPILNRIEFKYSDVIDNNFLKLYSILVKYQHCYATHRNDVGRIASLFRNRLKPNA